MADTATQPHSATSSEATDGSKDNTPTMSEAFSSPAGNVFFKSPDNVVFRVEDFYLKANSGLFRDMLTDSVASTSLDNPLPVDEDSKDFEILLLIIVGRGEEAMNRVTTWKQAEKLYRMGDKYQLDAPRPWFSRICAQCAPEKPWDALFLACNVSPMDAEIIRSAISEGFREVGIPALWDPRYFKEMRETDDGDRCSSTIRIDNITTLFGKKFGLLGLLAYKHTFHSICTTSDDDDDEEGVDWAIWAHDFVESVKEVEKEQDSETAATE